MHPLFFFFFFFFLLLLLIFPAILGQPSSPADDLRSLLEFRKGITGDESALILSSWTSADATAAAGSGAHCFWRGVSCNGDGNVVAISLDSLGLSGDLKLNTLVSIRSLRNLTLSSNNFTGRLVPTMGSMTSLQHLDLSENFFSGKIPDRIAELYGLLYLNLSGNQFSEALPGRIQNLEQLRVLDLRSNLLSGDAGEVLSGLRNTEHVDLSCNRFSGGLDMESGSFSSLGNTVRHLNLSRNELGGGFLSSDSVRLFRKLEVLDVSNNRLTGQLPSFDSMFSLRVLRLGNNLLSGPVPEGLLWSTMSLEELDLSGNGFTGNIQSVNSTTLKLLNLSSNGLSGSLPSSLGGCLSVDLSQNTLSGDLSMMQNWGDTVEVIDLSSNMLSGSYPSETSQFESLMCMRIKNNSLAGDLPSVLGNYPRLSILDLSSNKLTGPVLHSLIASLSLTSLNLSGNTFSGPIPFENPHSTESLVMLSSSHLQSLDLSDNSLSGSLSQGIGTMQRLELLSVRNNTLSGELPSEIGKLGGLKFLDLSNNRFSGRIPDIFQPSLEVLNISCNDLSGAVPQSLERFPSTSFHPGNDFLVLSGAVALGPNNTVVSETSRSKSGIRVAVIVGSVGAALLIFSLLMAFYRMRSQEFCGRKFRSQPCGTDVKFGRFTRSNILESSEDDSVPTSMGFSKDHLLTSASRSLSAQKELLTEIVEYGYSESKGRDLESVRVDALENCHPNTDSEFTAGSPLSSSPHFIDLSTTEQSVILDVCSPDRLTGELFFLDASLVFTAEELSHAPAEVLGRSSQGTSYKAALDNGHMLTVKWLRVGLLKHKKDFAKEAKRIGIIRHPNIIAWRGYYWGPSDQDRLIIADYVQGDSLSLHLYESTPRRYSHLSVRQRLKIAIDIARCLCHLHQDCGLPHGNLKPSNIILCGPDLTARVTDYGLHCLMTPRRIAEQILNLGALGYRAPELAAASKVFPSFKADVYAFGVIVMELLTRKSAGDIISGHLGAVDLTDWVQMCAREGRGSDCFDREIAGLEEAPRVMDELLSISLRCILPTNERPNIRKVYDELCSIAL